MHDPNKLYCDYFHGPDFYNLILSFDWFRKRTDKLGRLSVKGSVGKQKNDINYFYRIYAELFRVICQH